MTFIRGCVIDFPLFHFQPNKPTADAVDSSFFNAVRSKAHSQDHLRVNRVDGRASTTPAR